MLHPRAKIVSIVLTILLLLILGAIGFFGTLLALNGVSESRALVALGIMFLFQILLLILAGVCAGWTFKFLVAKMDGNSVLAGATTVLAVTFLGSLLSFFSIILSILLAGVH